jgi:hypothetical protein
MATQTIEFAAPSGQTVTAKLFSAGSDTQIASVSASEAANRKGVYTASFTDLAPGAYRLIGLSASSILLCQWWVETLASTATYVAYEQIRSGYSLAVTPPTSAQIADAVWDEDNRDHLLAHSTGKNLDTIRKANYVTDGLVAAGGTPTTTTFRTTLTQPDDTYDHQTLLFLTGNLEGESKPILSYSQTNGEITLDEALTEAPVAGDEFVILPHHVHPLSIMVSRIFANEVESGGYTLTRTLQAIGSMLAGLVSGAGSGTESFKAIGNSAKTRVQFIVDDDGNRTGVTYDWS